jgi:hypothetical protein
MTENSSDSTLKIAKELLEFNEPDGCLVWKARPREMFKRDQDHYTWNLRYAGRRAGRVEGMGYIQINMCNKLFMAHRLVWLLAHGRFPELFLDHIDLDKQNNRLSNLREATRSQNGFNRPSWTGNLKGASYKARNNKWQAMIGREYLGLFNTEQEAHAAYLEAAKLRCGDFARA